MHWEIWKVFKTCGIDEFPFDEVLDRFDGCREAVPGQQDRQVGGAVEHHGRQRVEHVGKQDVEQAGDRVIKLFFLYPPDG